MDVLACIEDKDSIEDVWMCWQGFYQGCNVKDSIEGFASKSLQAYQSRVEGLGTKPLQA